jgi:superfamily II DNA helicase RecQ
MQQLGKLVAAETQMVLLTATLPPSEEEELYRRMHFQTEQVDMFRARTARVNVAYRVVYVQKAAGREEEEAVLRIIQRRIRMIKSGKVVVYGGTVGKVKKIAEELGCNAYYHDAVGKASMLGEFMEGKQRVIVATSALGMGVDIPDIRCIIHVDRPRTLLDYAQESGRAGRDGLRSEAIIVEEEGEGRGRGDGQTEEEQQMVRLYMEGEDETENENRGKRRKCRRVVLDGYLDGREDRDGCEEGEEVCDVCGGVEVEEEEGDKEAEEAEAEAEVEEVEEAEADEEDEEEVEEAAQEERRRQFQQQEQERRGPHLELIQDRQQEFTEVEWLRRQLHKWAGRCGICEAAGAGGSNHNL